MNFDDLNEKSELDTKSAFSEIVKNLLAEEDGSMDELLSSVIKEKANRYLRENSFKRIVAMTGGVSSGIGGAKLNTSFLITQGMPLWLAGVTRATAEFMMYSDIFSEWAKKADENEKIKLWKAASTHGYGFSSVGGIQFVPSGLSQLTRYNGGNVLVEILRTVMVNPSVASAYKELNDSVDKRDKEARRMKRMSLQEDGTPPNGSVVELDKKTKKIIRNADKFERAVFQNTDNLTEDQIDTLTGFIMLAKNGVLSNGV